MSLRNQISKILKGALVTSLLALGITNSYADDFPSKEVTLIVNYGAGGTTDTATRFLSKKAEEFLGQPIVIINKTGGAGTVGPSTLAQSNPDGYTVGVTSLSPLTVTPHTQDVPFETSDFKFILGYFRYVYGIGVKGDSDVSTVADLVEKSKSGERVTIAVTSTDERVLVTQLNELSGAKLVMVPYKSSAEKDTAVLSGTTTAAMVGPSSATGHIKSGDMKLIASASPNRWTAFPDVLTTNEQGFEVAVESWAGLAAPAGTPDENLAKLQEAFLKAANDEEVAKQINGLGLDSASMDGAAFGKLVTDRFEFNGKAIKELGLAK